MPFLCLPVPQGDGSPFQWSNCGCAVSSELLLQGSVGRIQIEPWTIRKASGDTSGGIEGSVLAATANRLTSNQVPIAAQRLTDRAAVRDLLERHSIGVIINCAVTINTVHRTNFFRGSHWVTVAAGTDRSSDNTVKVEDPGTTVAGWKRWPRTLLFRAAEAIVDTAGHTGAFWMLVGQPTENVDRKARFRAAIRSGPDNASKRVGRVDAGEKVHVRRTRTGGPWRRPNGTVARGWHEIDKPMAGYVRGEALV